MVHGSCIHPLRVLALPLSVVSLLACQDAQSPPEATPAEPAAAVERAPEKIEQVTPVVKLELSGHDGKALLSGGVSVYRLGMKEAAVERELGPGRGGAVAELTLPEAGLYEFRVHGVDHAEVKLRARVENNTTLGGSLGTYERDELGEEVKLSLQWMKGEEEADRDTVTAKRVGEEGAKYSVELGDVPEGATALRYQLRGVTQHTINLPQSPRYVYDGGGDYWSERDWKAEDKSLEFDLSVMVPAGKKSSVAFKGQANALEERTQKIDALIEPVQDGLNKSIEEAKELPMAEKIEKHQAALAAAMAKLRPELDKAKGQERTELALQLAGFEMINTATGEFEVSDATTKMILETVPAEAQAWALLGGLGSELLKALDAVEGGAAYVEKVQNSNVEPSAQAQALIARLTAAAETGDEAKEKEFHAALKEKYSEIGSASFALKRFDPERPIKVGKAMPEWSFPHLGNTKETLSSADLAGKPYVFEVWGTWCGPCVADMPTVHAAYAAINGVDPAKKKGEAMVMQAAADPKVHFVSMAADEVENVQAFRKDKWSMPWNHLQMPEGESQQDLRERWHFSWVPFVILVDKEGTVAAVDGPLRGEKLQGTLRAHLDS